MLARLLLPRSSTGAAPTRLQIERMRPEGTYLKKSDDSRGFGSDAADSRSPQGTESRRVLGSKASTPARPRHFTDPPGLASHPGAAEEDHHGEAARPI